MKYLVTCRYVKYRKVVVEASCGDALDELIDNVDFDPEAYPCVHEWENYDIHDIVEERKPIS